MMKNFLRKLWRTKLSIWVRNIVGIRPVYRRWYMLDQPYAASDQFFWRTDNEFKTHFRVSDIVGKYYGEKSRLRIHIFDRQGREINQFEKPVQEAVEHITIDKNNAAPNSYGTFNVFHIPDTGCETNFAITNRCYTGYSRLGSMPSFVHGNLLSKILLLGDGKNPKVVSGFLKHRKKTEFSIQKDFEHFDRSELVFVNPLDSCIKINVGETGFKLDPGAVQLVNLDKFVTRPVKIQSDFFFPRPIVFSFKQQYFDVHHG